MHLIKIMNCVNTMKKLTSGMVAIWNRIAFSMLEMFATKTQLVLELLGWKTTLNKKWSFVYPEKWLLQKRNGKQFWKFESYQKIDISITIEYHLYSNHQLCIMWSCNNFTKIFFLFFIIQNLFNSLLSYYQI